jgi:hypothetical protein
MSAVVNAVASAPSQLVSSLAGLARAEQKEQQRSRLSGKVHRDLLVFVCLADARSSIGVP